MPILKQRSITSIYVSDSSKPASLTKLVSLILYFESFTIYLEVEKRKVLNRELETVKSSLSQVQKDASSSEEQLSRLQTKFAEVDTLLFEKTEKIMMLEGEVKELEETKRSLEEEKSRVDPSEIVRKDLTIRNLEETLVRSNLCQ